MRMEEQSVNNVNIVQEETERETVLIIDDSEMNRAILTEMLQADFDILEAEDGEAGVKILQEKKESISLVMLDIVMPGMDGFEVLGYMNRAGMMDTLPVIMISSEDSQSVVRRAYDMGASDYISRPFDAQIVYRRVMNTIMLYAKQRRLLSMVTKQIYEKEKNNRIMISILSQVMGFRNSESAAHILHINMITSMLLERLIQKTDRYQLDWNKCLLIATASALHDIGKIGIPDGILNKPGRLTSEEYEIMKGHTTIGAEMLERLDIYRDEELVRIAYEICRGHHERYDGKGYPDGLKGDEIPISAQVVSLADVYDALTSVRVYKPAYSHEEAIRMILDGECGVFNPLLLDCLEDIAERLKTDLQDRQEEVNEGSVQEELSHYENAQKQFIYAAADSIQSALKSTINEQTAVYAWGGLNDTRYQAAK